MYADINGKTLVVTSAEEGSTYQYQVHIVSGHLSPMSSALVCVCVLWQPTLQTL